MEILHDMLFEEVQKLPITGPDGKQGTIDAYISPIHNFVVPYLPWPIKMNVLIVVKGIKKTQIKGKIFDKSTGSHLMNIEGEFEVLESNLPFDVSTSNLLLNLNNIIVKNEGEYTIDYKIGDLSSRQIKFNVIKKEPENDGTAGN